MNECTICFNETKTTECKLCYKSACKKCWSQFFRTKMDTECMFCGEVMKTDNWINKMDKKTYDMVSHALWEIFISKPLFDINSVNIYNKKELSANQNRIVKNLEMDDKYFKKCDFFIKYDQWKVIDTDNIVFSDPCPVEGCIGLLSKGSCVKCGIKICATCGKVETLHHVCKEEDIENVKALKETYRCPKCLVQFVSDGCYHNYCFLCKIHFNRKTGEISETPHANPDSREFEEGLKGVNVYEGLFEEDIVTLITDRRQQVEKCMKYIRHARDIKIMSRTCENESYLKDLQLKFFKSKQNNKKLFAGKYMKIRNTGIVDIMFKYYQTTWEHLQEFYKTDDPDKLLKSLENNYKQYKKDSKDFPRTIKCIVLA